MAEALLFYNLQKNMLKNLLREIHKQSLFKITVVSTAAIVFWASLFVLFYRGFGFLFRYVPQDFSAILVDYVFALFYFALLVMLGFSATLIAFSVFFHARETHYLMTCPLSTPGIFFYKLAETSLFASWAVFFLGLPVCFAYGIQQQMGLPFYLLLVVAFVPYTFLPTIFGGLVAMLVSLYLVQWRRLLAVLFIAGLTVGLIWWGYSIARLEKTIPVFTNAWLFGLLDYLNFARHPLLPSTWMAKAMNSLFQQEYSEFWFYLFLLLSTTAFLLLLCYLVTEKRYALAWSRVHTMTSRKNFWKLTWVSRLTGLFVFLKPQARVFLEKDIKTFVRDPLQWGQFAILLGLLILYTLNLRTFKYDQQNVFWKHVIAVLNLTATAFTICTFSSRFIFPLLSLEGKRFWTIGVMPIKRSSVLMAKFLFAVVTLLMTGELLIVLSCYMLWLPWQLTVLHLVTMLGVTVGVAGLSVGLGAIYPNFREDSPAKIVSGFGGTLNLVLNMVFVMAVVVMQLVPSYMVLKRQMDYHVIYLSVTLTAVMSGVACIVPLYLGISRFNRMEI